MKKLIQGLLLLVLATLASGSWAYPALQLDIGGGVYDWGTQTIVTQSPEFTLYAYGNTAKGVNTTDTYYISIALVDMLTGSPIGPDAPVGGIGSFDFGGSTFDIGDMAYGQPPVELGGDVTPDPGDLPSHSIFPTYFAEVAFTFSGQTTAGVNTQDNPGTIPDPLSGDRLLFEGFTVDATNLSSGIGLHFDLYNTKVKTAHSVDDFDVDDFAPFSHDAEYVPEPGSVALLSIGLLGLGLALRRRNPVSVR